MNLSLSGKTYVVMGVANKRSIAWGIARSLHNAGASLIFTYAGERLESSVRELA
ncbi:MAG: SDR family oxidoreductase, partial [Bacillus sp. (in: firmicutes)]